jgi:hypothetical protein
MISSQAPYEERYPLSHLQPDRQHGRFWVRREEGIDARLHSRLPALHAQDCTASSEPRRKRLHWRARYPENIRSNQAEHALTGQYS